ncbi:MAG: hypothetical protein A2161_01350 [Candidatus Schekmanbacteria bacterium RBG_13_48_7]|uniref:Uncharacterized protein n=1 Tax=Candidatus Schekmanbacteria bacterium RBG_13_48_7 TaxID=1817878 RepID=A0A1F7RNQ9_9BACT|nr:MAG: hypothetical protein A2161_01350 [Candidatus Schekmanbacteria bacterium RBG_13_48_7]
MEKTCPICFDIECEHIVECEIPRLIIRCKHLQIDADSTKVFMGNPVKNCTVVCQRTKHLFGKDELFMVVHCTRNEFEEGKCPRASEPDRE